MDAAREENRTLRKQIAQMIALSQEEDAETEKLMQSMHQSLNDARRVNGERDGEMMALRTQLAEAKAEAKREAAKASAAGRAPPTNSAQVRPTTSEKPIFLGQNLASKASPKSPC